MRVRSMVGLLPILGATELPAVDRRGVPRRHDPAALAAAPPSGDWSGRCCRASGPDGAMLLSLRRPEAAARAPGADVRPGRVPVAATGSGRCRRRPRAVDGRRRRARRSRSLRAGGVAHRPVRRQLELARAGLVPGERAARGQAAHVCGRHFGDSFTDRDPDRLGQPWTLVEARRRDRRPADGAVPPVDGRRPATASGSRPATTRCGGSTRRSASSSTATPARASGATHQTGWTALVAHLICTPQSAYDPGESPNDG